MVKAGTKYGKYILREPLGKANHAEIPWPVVKMTGEKDCGGAAFVMVCECVSKPFLMIKDAHAHDFDQFLVFIGGNPQNMKDFGAEVELSLGTEGEKHIFNSSTIVYVPKGLRHCPLNFKKIDKPIIFMDLGLTPTYARKPLPISP
jgi:hypothetical protein